MTLSAVSAIFVTLIYAGHFTVCKTISSFRKTSELPGHLSPRGGRDTLGSIGTGL